MNKVDEFFKGKLNEYQNQFDEMKNKFLKKVMKEHTNIKNPSSQRFSSTEKISSEPISIESLKIDQNIKN